MGAGCRYVAVECAKLGAAAVAVEKAADGAARVRANAAAHGVDVRVVRGAAPAALDGLDDRDAVFVGGGGRELPGHCHGLGQGGRRAVVVAMAALDRVPVARRALLDAGLECDGVLPIVPGSRRCRGTSTRLAAADPFSAVGPATSRPYRRSSP
ncbi:Precorrin-6y C5,15-methyltransferase subunit CbiE OS=Streptomyces fumanus OX=67302 GN=GCM10018772_64770 PE=3 SV=1 [Streptomyces fumanus]